MASCPSASVPPMPRRAPRRSRPGRGQSGSATIYVLSLVLLLLAGTVGVAGFAGLATAKHRATAAADLAALAAASTPGDGCPAAAGTAEHNGVRLTSCRCEGSDVTVTVAMVARGPFGLRPTVTAMARAGPPR
jgi:secretion/DNA translocation related TadE-like protein